MSLIDDEILSYIGVESEPRTSRVPVSEEMLRRFTQGVMEDDPVHWDAEAATASRYGEVVAPPLFPLQAFRRPPGEPDPFDALADRPNDDGTFPGIGNPFGLPNVKLPLKGRLNGGTEAEFRQLAKVGDLITARSKYADIVERTSRKGDPMVIIRVETTYTNQEGEVLAVITISMIAR